MCVCVCVSRSVLQCGEGNNRVFVQGFVSFYEDGVSRSSLRNSEQASV